MTDDNKPPTEEDLGLTPGARARLGLPPEDDQRVENERDPETGELTAQAVAARLYMRR